MGGMQPVRRQDVRALATTRVESTPLGCTIETERRIGNAKGRISACTVQSDKPLVDVRCYDCAQQLRKLLK